MLARNEYREKADDCILRAELIRDSRNRAPLLTIAQFYMKLADRLGEHQRGAAHRSQGDEHGQNDS